MQKEMAKKKKKNTGSDMLLNKSVGKLVLKVDISQVQSTSPLKTEILSSKIQPL